MSDTTVPTVSAKISAMKSAEVIVQAILGYIVAIACIKLTNKFGVVIDQGTQVSATAATMVAVTGVIHGAYNWFTHKWPKLDIFKVKKV